jgi:hypothetical protein
MADHILLEGQVEAEAVGCLPQHLEGRSSDLGAYSVTWKNEQPH